MDPYLHKKIVFFGGKGGVGKSTMSSAFAWAVAKKGKKALLISTDPAHNLGDIFQTSIGGKGKKVEDNLWIVEIDPHQESHRYIDEVKNNLKQVVHAKMIDEINRQVDIASVSPGAEEAALFDKIVDIIREKRVEYDIIVFDTAPTGHTIRLLSLPELMGAWIDGMINKREKINKDFKLWMDDAHPIEDPIYKILNKRKEKFAEAREVLMNPKETSFVFVLTPEFLPIVETGKAIKTLGKHKIPVENIIVNKILPEIVEGSFFMKRKAQERKYIKELEDQFKKQRILKINMLEEDISSRQALEHIVDQLVEALS